MPGLVLVAGAMVAWLVRPHQHHPVLVLGSQPPSDGEDLAPHSDDLLEAEDDDDIREDAHFDSSYSYILSLMCCLCLWCVTVCCLRLLVT